MIVIFKYALFSSIFLSSYGFASSLENDPPLKAHENPGNSGEFKNFSEALDYIKDIGEKNGNINDEKKIVEKGRYLDEICNLMQEEWEENSE